MLQRAIDGVEIGYRHIKDRRANRAVPGGTGGTLADYVSFYFAPPSPMLFATTRGQVSVEAARTEQIVDVVSSTQTLRAAGLTVVCSNRQAERAYAELTDQDEVLDGEDFVDWPLMQERYWPETADDPDRKDRRQAECLVRPNVPWGAISVVVAETERARRQVEEVLVTVDQTTPVIVRPDWYF